MLFFYTYQFLLTGMELQMILQVSLLAETAVADLALERPAPRVDVHVALQVARRGE